MKVHIAFDFVDGPHGGGNQFLKALRSQLEALGCYSEHLDQADVVLLNSFHRGQEQQVETVMRAKQRNPNLLVIHRLDGPFRSVRGYSDYADHAIAKLNPLVADGTVFQSHWSKKECLKLGLREPLESRIISNAPQQGLFSWSSGQKIASEKIRLVSTSWSSNKNKGFDVYSWLDNNLDWTKYEMTFFGNTPVNFRNIQVREPLTTRELARELRLYDLFVAPSRNESCSNAIIEALHSGLPVIGFNGGGTPELVGDGGVLFNSPSEIPSAINSVLHDIDAYRGAIKAQPISEIARQYLDFIDSVQKKSPRTHVTKLQVLWFRLCFLEFPGRLFWTVKGRVSKTFTQKTRVFRP